MLTGYPLSCTLGRRVLGIGNGVAHFLMTAEYATVLPRLSVPRSSGIEGIQLSVHWVR